jgi:hypothetical protein
MDMQDIEELLLTPGPGRFPSFGRKRARVSSDQPSGLVCMSDGADLVVVCVGWRDVMAGVQINSGSRSN